MLPVASEKGFLARKRERSASDEHVFAPANIAMGRALTDPVTVPNMQICAVFPPVLQRHHEPCGDGQMIRPPASRLPPRAGPPLFAEWTSSQEMFASEPPIRRRNIFSGRSSNPWISMPFLPSLGRSWNHIPTDLEILNRRLCKKSIVTRCAEDFSVR